MAGSTRSSTEDPLFGQFLDKLPEHQLPLEIEVVRHYLHLREIENEFDSSYMRSGKLIKVVKPETKLKSVRKISASLKSVWIKASIPVKTDKSIEQHIDRI